MQSRSWLTICVVIVIAWFGVSLGGCTGVEMECNQEESCDFGDICVGGQCVSGHCSTSAQCPMEFYCKNRSCTAGCKTDGDCIPGSRCDLESDTCVAKPCVDSQVDCGYREFCNTATGECYDAGNLYCKPCDRDNQVEDCGADNECWAGYCGVDCSEGRACPGGFDCYPFGDESGNIVSWQCITYCWLYEDYEPGQFAKTPPDLPGRMLPIDPACPVDLPSVLEK
jgi:hypothetical protein